MTGLRNGVAYTFTVMATNATGTGPASAPSNSVTPAPVAPDAPTGVSAWAGKAQAMVYFSPPASDGGSAITGYTATSNPDGKSSSGASSPISVTGLANGTNYTFTVVATNNAGTGPSSSPSNSVRPAAAQADFNGDGKQDILWRNVSTGVNTVWLMNGATEISGAALPSAADLNWKIAGVGDFNGDGKPDILWKNASTGENYVWYMNGATQTGGASLPALADLNWKITGTGDFNGDGKPDILWRNTSTGENLIWYMDGVAKIGNDFIPTVSDQNWTIGRTCAYQEKRHPGGSPDEGPPGPASPNPGCPTPERGSTTDRDGVSRTYGYNAQFGWLTTVTDHEGNRISYGYASQGDRTSEDNFDPSGKRTFHRGWDFGHSQIPGKLWKEIAADGSSSVISYDNATGLLSSRTGADRRAVSFSYDTLATAWGYDQANRLVSMGNAVADYQFTLDADGNRVHSTEARPLTPSLSVSGGLKMYE